ncbi:hypothetical protein CFOL_v3_24388, partial [Cephalotus follicularis]
HMTGDKSIFVNFESKEGGDVTFGDNAKGKIKGFGSIGNNQTSIHNVLYVDGLKHNLLSISQLCDKDCRVTFCSVPDPSPLITQSELRGSVASRGVNLYIL